MGFEYLGHPSDVGIRAWGKTPDEVFRDAARAVFTLMVDPKLINPSLRRPINVRADDLETLLVEWLAALLAEKDLTGLIFSDFEVSIDNGPAGYTLEGAGLGEGFDPKRHSPGTEVKGVSYLGLAVKEEEGRWIVECVVDL